MRRRRMMLVAAAAIAASSAVATGVSADHSVEVVRAFVESPAHLPEGVTVDKSGNLYVSLGPPFFVGGGYGEIRQIAPDGSETTLVKYPNGPAPAGLAVSPAGTVYFALPQPGGSQSGVYRVTDDGAVRLAGTETMLVPNGLTIDKGGDVYASDSARGEIWRIPRDGGPGAAWAQHELLAGCVPTDVGANGIAFWKGDLYVANTSRGLLVKIPVATDGSPGQPEIVAGDLDCDPTDQLFGMDGIAFDVHGDVYALLVLIHDLVRIDPATGDVTLLADENDGLWNPASLAFGTGKGDRQSVFITNYAVLPPIPPDNLGPAILALDVGVPGLPIP